MKPADIARRRERIQRVQAKRPRMPEIRVTYKPREGALDELADLVLELLDARAYSSGK